MSGVSITVWLEKRTNSNYQKEDPIRVLHIQSGTQENVMDYQMTLVTKGGGECVRVVETHV